MEINEILTKAQDQCERQAVSQGEDRELSTHDGENEKGG